MVTRIIALLLFIMILNGCKPSGEDMAGRYYAKHNKGTEYIDIKADGTYLHYLKSDSTERKQEGKWEYERDGLSLRFIMYDWIEYVNSWDGVLVDEEKSIVNTLGGTREIIMNPDEEEYNFHREDK